MIDYFPYPNLERKYGKLESKLRRNLAKTPEIERLRIYEVFTNSTPGCVPTAFEIEDAFVIAVQAEQRVTFPRPLPINNHCNIVCGYETWLKHKYSLPGFVEVAPGDIVVDCGAYVGGFALSALRTASQVHLFEPETTNLDCIRRNLASFDSAVINAAGLYSETKAVVLNVADSSVEHSLLTPDVGQVMEQRTVQVFQIFDYCESNGVGQIDFFKVEAEGVEVEVLEGMRELRPSKLAIDVSPERNQTSPAATIVQMLEGFGYECQQRANVLFARLGSS